jgi:hypothetical protein
MDDLAVVGGGHVRVFREGEAHPHVLAPILVPELPPGEPGFHGQDVIFVDRIGIRPPHPNWGHLEEVIFHKQGGCHSHWLPLPSCESSN